MEIEGFGLSNGALANIAAIEPKDLITPLGFVVGGLLLGFIFEKIVLKKLRDYLGQTKWHGSGIVVRSIRGVVTLWFGIAGVYLALVKLPLQPTVVSVMKTILLVALILSGVLVVTRIAGDLVSAYSRRVQGLPSSSLLPNLTRLTILALGVMIILQSVGIAISPIIAALGVGGIAVALALQETLSNVISGVLIIASRQLRPGDYVSLGTGTEGYVVDVTWRNTTIRSLANNMIIVPNETMSSSTITNYYQPERQMSVIVPLRVGYESDLSHVEEVTIEVATGVMTDIEGGVPEFQPSISYNNLGDYGVDFNVVMRTREVAQQYRIKHEFIKRIHARFSEEGIEIPYPVVTNIHANRWTPDGVSQG